MGIYPAEKFTREGDLLYRRYNDFSGLITTEVFQLVVVHEFRDTCFCCSCGDREGSDPACRNHGFAATRPCEDHGTPGSVWDAMTAPGEEVPDWHDTMPESVQEYRRMRKGNDDA
jgi:hypothetical protein